MKLQALAALYLVTGAGLAVVVVARRGLDRHTALDGALLLVCWPLYAPFAFARPAPRSPLLAALAALRHGPLAPLLPDDDTLTRLAARLARATARAAELDALTARPDFDPALAEARAAALTAHDQPGAADAARRTAAHLHRLRALRARAHAELAEVEERLRQLRAQAEVMRHSGECADAAALIGALAARIEDLDDALTDPVLCPE
ncbi:MAG: hypothetical protein H6705_09555 [Myxococcales bacterium]|nr:hypothetical protein [Myxococcales bacterium]